MRQRIQRFTPLAQQLWVGKVGSGKTIAIVTVNPVIQRVKQHIVHDNRRIHRLLFLQGEHHSQAQACRTAAVGHTFTQIEYPQIIDRIVFLEKTVQIPPHTSMLPALLRQDQHHRTVVTTQQLTVKQIGSHRILHRNLRSRDFQRGKTCHLTTQLL